MDNSNFDSALKLILQEEGGAVDLKEDPGGRTNFGILQRTYDAWRDAQGLPPRDVFVITAADVAAIYRNAYADPIRFDSLPPGVGYCVLDDAVNSGPVEAVMELQRAVGCTPDGAIGIITLAKVAKADRTKLINTLCDGRLSFMRRLKSWSFFSRGWSARVDFVREHALGMTKP